MSEDPTPYNPFGEGVWTPEAQWPNQRAWTLEADGSRTLRVSPNSLEKIACPARYANYKLRGRIGAADRIAAVAGAAFHAGVAALKLGKPVAEQEAAVVAEFDKANGGIGFMAAPGEEPDYRTALFVQDALAQYRAQWAVPRWTTLRVEDEFDVPLVERHQSFAAGLWRVLLVVRIDEAIRADDNRLWLVDTKTSSQDRLDDLLAYSNSQQFKLYGMAYWLKYGEKPVGLIPDRVIMRRPVVRKSDKTKPTFEFPIDKPVWYDWRLLGEAWTAAQAECASIIERLDKPEAWHQREGCCVGRWGACEYLPVCTLPPEERALKLATDAYRDAERR